MAEGNESKVKNFLFGTQNIGALIPGVLLAIIIMFIAIFLTKTIGDLLPMEKNPLSAILIAIVLGLILRSTIKLPQMFDDGIIGKVER